MLKLKKLQEFALDLRRHQTEAEKQLWFILRNKKLGFKFRRQQPIDFYIADFVCYDQKLIIELDGGQHTQEKDYPRTTYLTQQGFRTLRFWNDEVLKNPEGVFQKVYETLHTPHPAASLDARQPTSPARGEVKELPHV